MALGIGRLCTFTCTSAVVYNSSTCKVLTTVPSRFKKALDLRGLHMKQDCEIACPDTSLRQQNVACAANGKSRTLSLDLDRPALTAENNFTSPC